MWWRGFAAWRGDSDHPRRLRAAPSGSVAKAELPGAQFHSANGPRFDFEERPGPRNGRYADEQGWQFFRLAEGTLAEQIVNRARARTAPPATLTFDYAAYRAAGWPKLSNVQRLAGRTGWLTVSLLSVKGGNPDIGQRDRLIVAGFCDGTADEIEIDQATVDDLFLVPALSAAPAGVLPADRMANFEANALKAAIAEIEDESRRWLDEETEKLDAYADDLEQAAERRVKELEAEIKAAKKGLRATAASA